MKTNPSQKSMKVEEFKDLEDNQIDSSGAPNSSSPQTLMVPATSLQQEISNEPKERTELPWLKDPSIKLSIWAVIKDSIGKDISKLTVPVYFNDPLNLLQKCAASCEYVNVLD